jgi:uncharacterized membrane-anchored protein YitT (DUF2179 family)
MAKKKLIFKLIKNFSFITLGAFLAALAIRIFLYPNFLIDGGIIGISLILARIFSDDYLPYFLIALNLPFIYLAFKRIRKSFVLYMLFAVLIFAFFIMILRNITPFYGDSLEVIFFGGATLGAGVGLMIKNGACTDGTEILGIIVNRKMGFTVGQIVLFINIFIFAAYGLIFQNWHIALKSLLTYVVAFKMIDIVIAGLEEVKLALIMTKNTKKIKDIIMHELGFGLTIIPSFGGFSGKEKDILFVIVERLDLAELKQIVLREDENAFIAVQNIHEVAYGNQISRGLQKRKRKKRKRNLLRI